MFQALFGFLISPADQPEEVSPSSWTWLSEKCKWSPTSVESLSQAEKNILSFVKCPYTLTFVEIPSIEKEDEMCKIRTLSINSNMPTDKSNVPLVLIHGLGAAIGHWVLNLDTLSKQRPLYAIDLLGFGMSSRPKFSSDPAEAEKQYIESIESWRREMNLEKIILLGHSMGGYLASAYALSYPHHISHLILADPWGFPERDKTVQRHVQVPFWVRTVAKVMRHFNPFTSLRIAGPWGPGLVSRFRPDLILKYTTVVDDPEIVSSYIYHCNAQIPSGETAFKTLSDGLGWAKSPMISRIGNLSVNVPITFIYGQQSWIDCHPGYRIQKMRKNASVDVQMISGAGHHVFSDQPEDFNSMVIDVCQQTAAPIDVIECNLQTLSLEKENEDHSIDSLPSAVTEQV